MPHPDHSAPVRVTIIAPVVLGEQQLAPAPAVPGLIAEFRSLASGTASIESRWDDAFAVPGILDAAIRAEEAGAQAVVIDCMDDPGLDAAREVVRIPVIGPAQASMHLALTLADRFSIITTLTADIPVVRELVEHNRLAHRCASVRGLGLSPLDLHDDAAATLDAFVDAARAAVEIDGAAAIIAGCTQLSGRTEEVAARLADEGIEVPVIDPLAAALHHALTLVRLGISHSGVGYPAPAAKQITWPTAGMRFERSAG
ncbi:aspartate/glutamate racemase family protein [Microbacterium esteraromaticum]|uniref:aspartate/glutamate racemase family protein n=1 Tax=Microbacterium esteraromaticum TaxID=57043 RepID=UPI00195DE6E2|nr:aspartate/glutamate racemase family protein [Microbacterium esteraromaticum]MBM7466309.1 allantoin racemase [Microbacterium esteraromaticum]